MTSINLQTARAVGRDLASMRRYHGDAFITYELAAPQVHGRVLDIACGTGVGTKFLGQHAKEVVGVDIDAEAIAYCNKRQRLPNTTYIEADASRELPFPSEHFDVITTFETIEHLYPAQRATYLAELRRVLKKNGRILLSTPQNGIEKQTRPCPPPKHPYDHKIEFSLRELRDELTAAGFRIEKTGGILHAMRQPTTGQQAKTSLIHHFQKVTKLVPTKIKERIGHRMAGYPFDISKFSYTEKEIDKAITFYLTLRK